MPFEKTGSCPFTGGHWPLQWGEDKITPKTFCCLNSDQREDLIEYFYAHESAKTSARPVPAYQYPLTKLRDYFGVDAQNLKRTVLNSQDYKDFVAERQRSQAPPPPPEIVSAHCSAHRRVPGDGAARRRRGDAQGPRLCPGSRGEKECISRTGGAASGAPSRGHHNYQRAAQK